MPNKYEIERNLRTQYQRKLGDNILNMNAYRNVKARQDAARKAKDIMGGLRTLSDLMKTQVSIKNDWDEMDRIFNDLFEMGAIPEVRVHHA